MVKIVNSKVTYDLLCIYIGQVYWWWNHRKELIFLNKVSKTIVAAVSLLGIVLSLGGCASSSKSQSSKTLTVVFLPSDSAKEESAARTDLSKKISEATGKKVKVQTTTDYNVAINAISSGKAQIALMGPDGYIEAHK